MKDIDHIKDLRFDKKNARKHNPRNIGMIVDSEQTLGMGRSILIDEDNKIIAGNGTVEAAAEAGIHKVRIIDTDGHEIIAVRRSGWTEEQKTLMALLDNRTAELATWNLEQLKAFHDEGLDLSPLFTEKELLRMGIGKEETTEDEVPDAPAEPKSRTGELFQLGPHRLLCGDATDSDALAKLMDGKKADAYITDPPYNVDYVGKTKDALKIQNDKHTDGNFREFLKDTFITASLFIKPGGVFYIWHADIEGFNFRAAAHDAKWKIRQCLIWNKDVFVMGRQDYHWKHEPCLYGVTHDTALYGWMEGAAHNWNSDRTQSTVLNFERPKSSAEHPIMKPVALIAYLMGNNTTKNELILDTFLGSGTTMIAAEQIGRVCYGTELDPRFIDVIINRWEKQTGKRAERINDDGTTTPWEDIKAAGK